MVLQRRTAGTSMTQTGSLVPQDEMIDLRLLSRLMALYLDVEPMRPSEMSPQQFSRLFAAGLLLGGLARLLLEYVRIKLVAWHGRAALAPVGSPEREKMYRRIAKQGGGARLLPSGVSLEAGP